MNFLTNLNIIIPIIIVLVIVITYYSYYSVKDMIKSEIKDFYIKTEKIKIKRDRKDKIIPQQDLPQQVLPQQVLPQQDQEKHHEPEFDMNDMSFLEMENNESYIDPLRNEELENDNKYTKNENEKEGTSNQILADRIFNL